MKNPCLKRKPNIFQQIRVYVCVCVRVCVCLCSVRGWGDCRNHHLPPPKSVCNKSHSQNRPCKSHNNCYGRA